MFFPGRSGNIFDKRIRSRKDVGSLPVILRGCLKRRERMSLPASVRGSMTVEAACILPLFIWAVVFVLYFARVSSMAASLVNGIQEAGKELGVYAYAYEKGLDKADIEAGGLTDMAAGGMSAVYVKSRIQGKEQAQGIDDTLLLGGIDSISLMRSKFMEESEIIDIVAEGKVRLPVPFLGLGDFRILQRARIRAWTGRDGSQGTQEDGEEEELVYVTVNGNVYHKDSSCSHISLSIEQVDRLQLEDLRNEEGGRYHACEKCSKDAGSLVYITKTGDRYHSSLDCSSLKRSVLIVPASQVEDWKPCSRCGR